MSQNSFNAVKCTQLQPEVFNVYMYIHIFLKMRIDRLFDKCVHRSFPKILHEILTIYVPCMIESTALSSGSYRCYNWSGMATGCFYSDKHCKSRLFSHMVVFGGKNANKYRTIYT